MNIDAVQLIGGQPLTAAPLLGHAQELPQHHELIRAVKAVNVAELFGQNSELTFVLDRETSRPLVRLIDRTTREVIRQIPPEYVLRMAGLENRRDSPTRVLAGGLKQRLALGCAILHRPPILFLDEPTSGVDPIARRSFWSLIYQLSNAGHTVFVTTHYMDEAEYCHRLALMHGGKIVALGSPKALKEELRSVTLMALDSDDPLDSMRALDGEPSVHDVAVFGAGLHVRVLDPAVAAPRIRQALSKLGIELRRLEKIPPSMEDVFVALIEEEERKAS